MFVEVDYLFIFAKCFKTWTFSTKLIHVARFCIIWGTVFSDLSALFDIFYHLLCSVSLVWINQGLSNNCTLGDHQLKESLLLEARS